MSVNIDIRGDWGSPTLITIRMSVYFTDTGMKGACRCPRPTGVEMEALTGAAAAVLGGISGGSVLEKRLG